MGSWLLRLSLVTQSYKPEAIASKSTKYFVRNSFLMGSLLPFLKGQLQRVTSKIQLNSAAITSIYDAAIDENEWDSVVDALANIVGSRGCALLLSDPNEAAPWHLNAMSEIWRNLPPEVFTFYYENYSHYEKPAFDLLKQRPKFLVKCSDENLATVDDFPRDREDVKYYIKHTGCHHRAACRLNDNPGWFDCITFQYDEKLTHIPKLGLNIALEYLPHLAKALEVGRLYRLLILRYKAIIAAFDHVRVGMVIASSSGELLVVNEQAEFLLSNGDGVRFDTHRHLRFTDQIVNDSYRLALLQVSNTAKGEGCTSCVTLLAPRLSQNPPLLVEMSPLRDPKNEIGFKCEGALVTIIDPIAPRGIDTKPLAYFAGLTATENAVCCLLARGYTNQKIGIERGTSLNTVKTQVASVFRKCQVETRSELIRLAARLSPPIGKF